MFRLGDNSGIKVNTKATFERFFLNKCRHILASNVCLLGHIVFQKLGHAEQTRYFTSAEPFIQSELLRSRFLVVCRQQLLQKTSSPALLGGF